MMRMISKMIVILCHTMYACIAMDSSKVPSLKECSIRAALATQKGRDLLLEKPRAHKNAKSQELAQHNLIPDDIKEEVALVFKKDPLSHTILHAYENPKNPLSTTAVYVYFEPANAFLKRYGDLTTLTSRQLQAVVQGHDYYKIYIGQHKTRLSQTPQSIGALVFGNDPDLRQKFDNALRTQTLNVATKWNVKDKKRFDKSKDVVYPCDSPGWKEMKVLP
jgi:hypothetical protein